MAEGAQLLDLESLRCFTHAAAQLSFRVAAKACALSPAAFGDRDSDRQVREASDRIAAAARHANKVLSVHTGGAGEAAYLSGLGATLFVLGSDQGFLRQGALASLGALKKALDAPA